MQPDKMYVVTSGAPDVDLRIEYVTHSESDARLMAQALEEGAYVAVRPILEADVLEQLRAGRKKWFVEYAPGMEEPEASLVHPATEPRQPAQRTGDWAVVWEAVVWAQSREEALREAEGWRRLRIVEEGAS